MDAVARIKPMDFVYDIGIRVVQVFQNLKSM